jgi:hypothetical protein
MLTFEQQTNPLITQHLHRQPDPMVIGGMLPMRWWHKDRGDAPFVLPAFIGPLFLN